MRTITLYHDGCNICLGIAATFTGLFDSATTEFEIVNLGRNRSRVREAADAGVTMLPSLVVDGNVLEISPHSDVDHLMPKATATA